MVAEKPSKKLFSVTLRVWRQKSAQDSGKFVNGILDKIKGELMRPARIVK